MKIVRLLALSAAVMAVPGLASAHPDHQLTGFAGGLAHPFLGLDHLLAMVAVGLWAALQTARRAWRGPLLFVAMLAVGAVVGMAGIRVPFAEPGIAASVFLLGLLVAGSALVPASAALALIAAFAFLHGTAHGAEAVAPIAGYMAGFLVASGLLHIGGFLAGRALSTVRHGVAAAGLSIAAAGVALAVG